MLPKQGNADSEYEDAWAIGPGGRQLAIADGATESSFAQTWAHLLVTAYCRGDIAPGGLLSGLPQIQEEWQRETVSASVPWYVAEKRARGAFAAVLGLTISSAHRWTALAIGDCCLIHATGAGRVKCAFPLSRPEEFGNRPLLLASVPRFNAPIDQAIREKTDGCYDDGDIFLLLTDALAAAMVADRTSSCS